MCWPLIETQIAPSAPLLQGVAVSSQMGGTSNTDLFSCSHARTLYRERQHVRCSPNTIVNHKVVGTSSGINMRPWVRRADRDRLEPRRHPESRRRTQ